MARQQLILLLLFLLSALASAGAAVKGGDTIDREASEMGDLAQLVQKYIDKTGHSPSNWSDIWDEDVILAAKEHNPDRAPLYKRFSFVIDNPPMVSPYEGSVVEGTILIMRNDPVDLAAKPAITWKTGREWWFVWVTSTHRAQYAFVDENRLSIGIGSGKIELKKPDIPKEKLDAFIKKLTDMGFTDISTTLDIIPSPKDTSLVSSSSPIAPQTVPQIASASDTSIPMWFYGIIAFSVAAIVGGGWYFLQQPKK